MNKYGKVFGGIVLRESYDLAYTACYLYSNQLASLHNLDDVNFFKGVSAGSVLKYEAYIVYVEKHLVHVKVTISVKTPLKK
jgi:acyl-CoA hydrolase